MTRANNVHSLPRCFWRAVFIPKSNMNWHFHIIFHSSNIMFTACSYILSYGLQVSDVAVLVSLVCDIVCIFFSGVREHLGFLAPSCSLLPLALPSSLRPSLPPCLLSCRPLSPPAGGGKDFLTGQACIIIVIVCTHLYIHVVSCLLLGGPRPHTPL